MRTAHVRLFLVAFFFVLIPSFFFWFREGVDFGFARSAQKRLGASASPNIVGAQAARSEKTQGWPATTGLPLFVAPTWGKAIIPTGTRSLSLAQRRVEASAVWSPAAPEIIRALEAGQVVSLPVASGEVLQGIVNLVQKDPRGWSHVSGALAQGLKGEFVLSYQDAKPKVWSGRIMVPDREVGYVIHTEGDQPRIHRKPLESISCQGMPRAPDQPPRVAVAESAMAAAGLPQGAVPELDSRPESDAVLYLDFDGEIVTDPFWGGGRTISAQAAIMGSAPITNAQITEVWQRVAEDFKPFNVSVTTIRDRYDNAPIGARGRCIITPTDTWYSSYVGGVAYLRSFRGPADGYTSTIPCWAFNNSNPSVMALTISHELGHMMDLSHDGTSGLSYYGGHDSGVTSWGPIMGAPWYRSVTQWSKGEYPNANNQEDDFLVTTEVIAEALGETGYSADEAGGTPATAASLAIVSPIAQSGVIQSQTDADCFLLRTGGGPITVTCRPAAIDPNLDVDLTLLNGAGSVVETAPVQVSSLAATISTSVTSGTYYLLVKGKGRSGISGATIGYTSFGSAGAYDISGTYVPLPVTPLFTEHPAPSTTANQGTKVTLTGKTLSNSKVTYQWRKNGVNMPGKTAPTLSFTSVQPGDAATYVLVAKNGAGEVPSDPAVLVVNFKPIYVAPLLPAKTTVNSGADVLLTATTNGTATINYQWLKNGQILSGESGASLSLSSVDWFDGATYSVIASNSMGSTTSTNAVLVVNSKPVFLVQPPTAKAIALGGAGTLTATVAGTSTITYQWFKDGGPVPGATKVSLALSRTQATAEGTYFLRATNSMGSTDSDPVQVDTQDKPVINLQPVASLKINAGQAMTLTCAATGTETLLYQWQINNVNIPGATNPTYTVPAVSWLDRGTYRCVVTNAVGTATSKNCVVTIQLAPPVIITPPVDTKIAKNGTGVLRVVAGGTPTLKYQWFKDNVEIPRANGATLSLPKASAASTPGSYKVRVTNTQSPAGIESDAAIVTVEDPPVITLQPVAAFVPIGGSTTLSVVASGSPTLRYQWQKNNKDLPGQTNASLVLSNMQPTDTASFRVMVSNDVGKVTSATVKVTVQTAPSVTKDPISQVLYAYDTATFTVAATGSPTLKYQWRKDGIDLVNAPGITGATTATLKLASIQDANAGSYSVLVSNAVGSDVSNDAVLQVKPVPAPTLENFTPHTARVGAKLYVQGTNLNWTTKVTINGKVAAFLINRTTELTVTVPTGATTGILEVTTRGGVAQAPTTLSVVSASAYPNDDLIDAQIVQGSSSFTYSNNVSASIQAGEFYFEGGNTIWFHWRAPSTGTFAFTTAGTLFDTVLYLYTGPPIPGFNTLSILTIDDDGGVSGFGDSSITYRVTKGTDYYLSIDGYFTTGNTLLNIYPVIVLAPEASAGGEVAESMTPSPGPADAPPPLVSAQQTAPVNSSEVGAATGDKTGSQKAPGTDGFVGGNEGNRSAAIASLGTADVPAGGKLRASVELTIETIPGTPEYFGWTVFDKAGDAIFALTFDSMSWNILRQIAGEESQPTGQIFLPGSPYELELEVDHAAGTWGALLNGTWIVENQPLPPGALASGLGDVGAVWIPAPGASYGGKMRFRNLKIESVAAGE